MFQTDNYSVADSSFESLQRYRRKAILIMVRYSEVRTTATACNVAFCLVKLHARLMTLKYYTNPFNGGMAKHHDKLLVLTTWNSYHLKFYKQFLLKSSLLLR
jgi:hypothetical protein